MRDFRDAKNMAHGLREALKVRQFLLSNSEALEIVSQMFGVADWNTLPALINTERSKIAIPVKVDEERVPLPALPIKDTVPFPNMQMLLWIKRPKTIQALSKARSSGREIVLVAQRDRGAEEPDCDDVYEICVVGKVIDVGPAADAIVARSPALKGTTQVIVQTHGRVGGRDFFSRAGRYEVEVDYIDEGDIAEAPELIKEATRQFEEYAAAKSIAIPKLWPPLNQLHDPCRVADMIAMALPITVQDKQAVLAMHDSVARLQLVVAQMAA